MRIEATGSDVMKNARRQARGFTLIASLLMLLLLSGIAIGLLMMANTEGKVGGTDLQNNLAFHAADGGIEKMASDLSATFHAVQSPTAAEICALSGSSYQPAMVGVTWTQYSIAPASGCSGTLTATWGQISSGPNQGLWAQIVPINMQTTADLMGGQEVSMTRGAQVALIPVFQFGVFSESDLSFFSGPNFDVIGPVHTNGDLYPFVGPGSTLTFHNKIEAYGNVVRTQLANGWGANTNYNGTVDMPTAANGCSTSTTNCTAMPGPSTNNGDGSVTGAGSANPQTNSTYNTGPWNTFSKTTTNSLLINGNYYNNVSPEPGNVPQGTGAKLLSMPFVNGSTFPYQIIRRPLSSDSVALSQSREYNLAQIHVLLSDDPADLPGGATDVNNVRLANTVGCATVTGSSAPCTPYGIAASVPAGLPALSGGSTYNTYFATASNAIPAAGTCTSTYSGGSITATCPAGPDWPYPPAPWTAAMQSSVGAGTDPNCVLLCPTGAPYISNNGGTVAGGAGFPNAPTLSGAGLSSVGVLSFTPCPMATMLKGGTSYAPLAAAVPPHCNTAGWAASPYFPLVQNSTTLGETTNADGNLTATWNLIDGWLRVEYLNNSGAWVPVTNEWLSLGFARGMTPPTAIGTNPINPNAILLLQEPADRTLSGGIPTEAGLSATGTAPVCTVVTTGKCTTWTVTPPQVLVDGGTGSTVWPFGVTTTAMRTAPASSTQPLQSLSRFNWYPINFYDAREGEVRDNSVTTNSCATNGIMNAVEIDVGNLQQWLEGNIGTSGTNVNSSTQNGYVLYFSDRRGMLPNPTLYGTTFTKSGDSGLEDVVNSSSATGTPGGVLEAIPAGRTLSPEDVNEDGLLDHFGGDNMGLGFYGTVGTPTGKSIWAQITTNGTVMANGSNGQAPDPFGTAANARIASCAIARKNWVSGARHVLRLVDGTLGNLPVVTSGTLSDPGGFTVASENPVYVLGDYNTNSSDTTWNTPAVDEAGHSSAAVIADAVSFLSNNWSDFASLGFGGDGTVTNPGNRAALTTYYRVAVAGGKNINFPQPSWGAAQDFGTDGGVHNFLRYLENWSGQSFNYKGSIVSLYYATYATGIYKCCTTVYEAPTRDDVFDLDFETPSGLPPGTPMFRDVETLSYRQLFTTRQATQ
jgi:Tfp pilus assembly protein PilX